MWKKTIILWLLAVLFSDFVFADTGSDEKILTLGVSGTFTGALASVGEHVSNGMTDYLNWTANHGGIEFKDPESGKNKRIRIKVISEDNQYNAVKSAMAYARLKSRGVRAIIGFGSTPGEACAALASRDKIPYLSWYAYASPAGFRPSPQYYWTFLPTIAEAATPMIKWFVKKKWHGQGQPKIGIISLNLPSWRVLEKPGLTDAYVESIGGRLAGIEFISPRATDISLPLTRLVFEKNADCLILMGVLSQAVLLAKEMRRMGIDPEKVIVICNISAWDESIFKSVPKAVEGFHGEVHTVSLDKDVPGMRKLKNCKMGRQNI